jgi:hypothetical protein
MQAQKPPPKMPPLHGQTPQPAAQKPAPTAMPELEIKSSFISNTLPTLVMLSALAGLCVLGWYAYQEATIPRDLTDLPVIKAENGPYKITPSDPGGMEIPNLDKKIYNTITSNKAAPQQEPIKVRPIVATEEPLSREEIKEISATKAAKKVTKTIIEKKAPLPAPENYNAKSLASETPDLTKSPVPISRPKTVKKAVPAQEEIIKVENIKVKTTPVERKIPPPASMPEARAKFKATTKISTPSFSSGTKIQLGAFRSTEEAKTTWTKLKRKYPSSLNKLTFGVQKADLGAKGIFYRLHAGPLSDRDAANILCKKLIAKGQGCFVVK